MLPNNPRFVVLRTSGPALGGPQHFESLHLYRSTAALLVGLPDVTWRMLFGNERSVGDPEDAKELVRELYCRVSEVCLQHTGLGL
jgi:hypothetical protein